MEQQQVTGASPENHHDHRFQSTGNPYEDDELLDGLIDCLATAGSSLPHEFTDLSIPEMAEVVDQLPLIDAARVFRRLPLKAAITLCDFPDLRRRALVCEQLAPDLAGSILEGLSSDQRTEIVRAMSPHERHRLLPKVSAEVRKELEQLLQYKPDTAGGIMTTEFVSLTPEMTVQEALDHIRHVAAERESIYACYVLEHDTGHLLGAVSLRDLVMADPHRKVTEIMRRRPVIVHALDRQEEVADKVSTYNLLAVPVLEEDGRVVGFVTVDDVIDVLVEDETDRALRSGGVEAGALDEPYMRTSFLTLVRKRASWLVILFLGEMLTATAMGYFENEISKAVVLAIPGRRRVRW
jgi:magnesium transporter